jgi:ABC-type sugar transport system substrate-binding protein
MPPALSRTRLAVSIATLLFGDRSVAGRQFEPTTAPQQVRTHSSVGCFTIMEGESAVKKQRMIWLLSALLILGLMAAGCVAPEAAAPADDAAAEAASELTYEDLVVGYAQIGAESEWRTANTKSIKEEAERLNVELKFSDAQQKQENQIKAIRSFIAQQVDVIGVSPVVETGWETVFQEAKDAGIPLILVDRRAAVPEDLYATYLGSDFVEEGRRAGVAMAELIDGNGKIVELVGTVGSAPANDRYTGFREAIEEYPEMEIIASQSGDFTRAKGKEVMEAFLKTYGEEIDALYAHNDDMAIGAIQAIEEYGLKPGEDITIVSIDAVRGAFEAMIEGKLNCTVECNPLLGPQFFELALQVVNGEEVPKWVPSEEGVFYPDEAAALLPERQY